MIFLLLLLFFLKKDVQVAHRVEEIVISFHKAMKEEVGRRVAAVKAFELVEKKSQDLNAKLVEANQDKKSAEVALDGVEKQAEA